MSGLTNKLYNTYVHLMVWLGAAPPPGYEHLLAKATGQREYTLQEGETLFAVARKFGVHYERIVQANAIADPNAVQPGQTVLIPPTDWEPSGELPGQPAVAEEPEAEIAPEPQPEAEPVAEGEAEPEELVFQEPDWMRQAAEETPGAVVEEVEPAWTDEAEEEAPPEPEWLLAGEPAAESQAEAEAAPAADFGDRLEWLMAGEAQSAPVETPQSSSTLTATHDMQFRYPVQRGDTLTAIAKRYAVTVKDLIEANDIADPNHIYPGQKLTIPGYMEPKPTPPKPEARPEPLPPSADKFLAHTVVEGDTMHSISRRYGLTVQQLAEANHLREPYLLRAGQRLFIPEGSQPPAIQADNLPEEVRAEMPPPEPALKPHAVTRIDPNFPPLGPIEALRAFYVSYFAIGHPDLRQRMLELLDTTEFNAVVIDVKGDDGWLSYPTQIPLAHDIGAARPAAKDFEQVMAALKERGVYTIARVVTFKDNPLATSLPELAVKIQGSGSIWIDRDNMGWCDPFLQPVWDYNTQVAVEAAQKGFDEVQFDHLRFPTATQTETPAFTQEVTKDARVSAVTGFLSAVRGQLAPFGAKISAPTLGYTCWRKDDTQIGQDIERMGAYLDVLSPVLHPSTFGKGIPNYKEAIAYPYEVVYESAKQAVERVGCQVRPWLQDFQDYRFDQRTYGKDEIRAQIKGCFDAGCAGFMMWDPQAHYTQGAYAPIGRR